MQAVAYVSLFLAACLIAYVSHLHGRIAADAGRIMFLECQLALLGSGLCRQTPTTHVDPDDYKAVSPVIRERTV